MFAKFGAKLEHDNTSEIKTKRERERDSERETVRETERKTELQYGGTQRDRETETD